MATDGHRWPPLRDPGTIQNLRKVRVANNETKTKTLAGVGSESVQKSTGRDWDEWLELLDAEGVADADHKTIVQAVARLGLESEWWQQSVTVGYEQARGLREKHEKPGGYEIGRSKTLPVSAERLFRAWSDPVERAAWLPHEVTVRTANEPKSLRLTWDDGITIVAVYLWPKGSGASGNPKTQVQVQHTKLANAEAAALMKARWSELLASLASFLSG